MGASDFDIGFSHPAPVKNPAEENATDLTPTLAPTPAPAPGYDPVKRNELGRVVEGGGSAPVPGPGGSGGGVRTQVIPVTRSPSSEGWDSSEGNRRHLATLNVGDRFASDRQNSPTTANAANPHLPGSASYSVSVPPPPPRATTSSVGTSTPLPPQQGSIPLASHTSGTVEHVSLRDDDEEIYILTRRRFPIFDPVRVGTPAGPPTLEPASSPEPAGGATSEAPTSRYVLDVHDVHDMGPGSTPSSIDIKNEAGEVVRHVDLPPGDSRVIADLPPGNYTFTANSGTRSESSPSPVGDNADNFRVEISEVGDSSTPEVPVGGGS